MTIEKFRELDKIANEKGFSICGAAWAAGCYDIYKMDESGIPVIADATDAEVVEFLNRLES